MIRIKGIIIGLTMLALAFGVIGSISADFTGPYEMQNWSSSGISGGTTSITPSSGPTSSADFSYDAHVGPPAPSGVTYRSATFSTTAAWTGPISFDWTYSFFHAWYHVNADFTVFADGPSGTTYIQEVDFYNANYTGPQTFSGSTTIDVNAGYDFGFIVGGSNYDNSGIFEGNLNVTNFGVVIPVQIDIKPGSDPNSINLGSNGTVPVAILSSADFDATTVDPYSVTLAGAGVALKGKAGIPMASVEDVNGDGLNDLVVHLNTQDLELTEDDTMAVLEGETYDGMTVIGEDTIRVVP